mmetsp:Transcript_50833/g.99411  ORF Transcript_50833/g.99411 Transcript_50833/m.99411 type:complete len:105 (+) Transcript_50833:1023-1337(+)
MKFFPKSRRSGHRSQLQIVAKAGNSRRCCQKRGQGATVSARPCLENTTPRATHSLITDAGAMEVKAGEEGTLCGEGGRQGVGTGCGDWVANEVEVREQRDCPRR